MSPSPFSDLESADCCQQVVSHLRALIESGSDLDCYKINAFRVAETLGVSRQAALRAFLFATRLGVCDLSWDVHCPRCRGLPAFERHLMGLRNTAHCGLCEVDWELDFEDQVEVTFTPNPAVRALDFVDFRDRDFDGMMAYFGEVNEREGRHFTAADFVVPGEPKTISGDFAPGSYTIYNPSHPEVGSPLIVTPGGGDGATEVSACLLPSGAIEPATLEVPAGVIQFRVRSEYPTPEGFLVRSHEPLKNWVSAAYVTNQQDFRDLFGGEFLAPDTAFALRSVALMFTDIKSSTEMYEAMGDSQALALVRRHFEVMVEVIRAQEGAIVKTIGDAVMAAFPVAAQAVAAAVEIQRRFGQGAEAVPGIQVKVGVHLGPTIAVTSNEQIDYFGRTVNLAARVQGESDAGEVLLSPAVLEAPGVRAWLEEGGLAPAARRAHLKGISEDYEVFALVP